jgi:hypothetical protein
MNTLAALAVALLAAPPSAPLTCGDAHLAIALDAHTGGWLTLTADGQTLAAGDAGFVPFDVGAGKEPVRLESADARDGALETVYRQGDWQVLLRWRLDGARGLLVRSARVTWRGAAQTKLRGFTFRTPPVTLTGEGFYFTPGAYPPSRREAAALSAGGRQGFGGSVAPLLAQLSPRGSLAWLSDELTAGSDHPSGNVSESPDAIQVSQRLDAEARMNPGDSQDIGDAHLWWQPCGGEELLTRLHQWMSWVGHVVPADRSPWFPDTVLYSYYPGGTIGSGFHDLGGFKPATALLDRIADLGCNAIWLLPLEDRSPYQPNDYYRFAAGLGSAEDYKALVNRAHALGLHVLQDCVPHGGNNTNARAKAHPEWLVQTEDGKTFDYWCFDFNSPTWRDYMAGVARHYVQDFDVDGYRVDAVGGSKTVNWNPTLPYARASFAQLQGGLNMLRSLRGAVKALKPDGGLLAEVQGSVYGTVADAVYDFTGCYTVNQDLRRQTPEVFVSRLRRWLHEQDCAEAAGLLRLRHPESHDALRAGLWYGTDGERALMALSAWIPGIPLVYHEAEEGNREAFRQIFAWRKELPELSRGDADYLSVSAPPTVFACLRRLGDQASVVLINFGPDPVKAEVKVPLAALPASLRAPKVRDGMTGGVVPASAAADGLSLPVTLGALGYAVYALRAQSPAQTAPVEKPRNGERLVLNLDHRTGLALGVLVDNQTLLGRMDIVLPPAFAQLGPPRTFVDGETIVHERDGADGKLVLRYTPRGAGMRLEARWVGPRQPEYAALLWPVAAAHHWWATAADGVQEDTYAVRHLTGTSFTDSIYWRPQGTNVLFDSLLHPFGPAGGALAAEANGHAVTLDLSAHPPLRAQWLDRLGDRHELMALLAWRDADVPGDASESLTVDLVPGPPTLSPAADAPLRSIAGGWRFENAFYRLDISRSGAIRQLVRKQPAEQVVVQSQDIYTDHGFGADGEHFCASDDAEAGCRLWRDGDTWRLRFEGHLRGFGRFDLTPRPVDYRLDYTLASGPSFRLTAAARPSVAASGPFAFLAQQTILPDMTAVRTLRAGQVLTEGAIPPKGRVAETARLQPPGAPDAVTVSSAAGPLLTLSDLRLWGSESANVFADGRQLFMAWLDGAPKGGEAPRLAGVWQACSALWTAGDATPQAVGVAPDFLAPAPPAELLRDPSFEAAEAGLAQTVTGGERLPRPAVASPWLAPSGGRLVGDPVHGAARAAEVTGALDEYRLWRQPLDATRFAPGSHWRLSAWVKGRDIVPGDVGWKVGTLRFAVNTGQTEYVACPALVGTFDWREVSVDWTVPAGLRGLEVQVGLNGSAGVMWVDGVRVERVP